MLNDAEDRMIDGIIRGQGVTEENILTGLSEQQVRVWVHYALLGDSEKDLLDTVFKRRKGATMSTVQYVLAEAQMRILLNVLADYSLIRDGRLSPQETKALQRMVDKLEEMKKRKGAKWLNPKLKKSKSQAC